VNFVFANREDVLRIPNAALRFRPSNEVFTALKLEPPKRARGGDGADGAKVQVGGGPKTAGGMGERQHAGPFGGASASADEAPDRKVVWVLKGGLPSSIRVKTGTTDGSKTEVVEGPLAEGDQVIIDATLTDVAKSSSPALPGASPRGPGRSPF
jgi:HlyD family secretion protein